MESQVHVRKGPKFPAVDFKFNNSGNNTAILWKISVVVDSAEIDERPHLLAAAKIEGAIGNLGVTLTNMGWGAGRNIKLRLSSSFLDTIYDRSDLESELSVLSAEETRDAITVSKEPLLKGWPKAVWQEIEERYRIASLPISARFEALAPRVMRDLEGENFDRMLSFVQARERNNRPFDVGEFTRMINERGLVERLTGELLPTRHEYASAAYHFEMSFYREFTPICIHQRIKQLLDALDASKQARDWPHVAFSRSEQPPHVAIDDAKVIWSALSNRGETVMQTTYLGEQMEYATLCASPSGFFIRQSQGAFLPSDVTFCTVIEPELGKQAREYTVSRSIAPGEVDRLQMMIAATKSCKLRLHFKCYFDDNVLDSEPYEVAITNRRDQKFHLQYQDGGEVKSRADFEHEEIRGSTDFVNDFFRELTRQTTNES
jgi:hypothetical protein